jgi:polyisoprenoid-binding protein YceI
LAAAPADAGPAGGPLDHRSSRKDVSFMKTLRFTVRVALPLLMLAVAAPALAEVRTFHFDKSHTEVGFNVRHIFTKVHGRFTDFTGSIKYDPQSLATSSVVVTIRDSSIDTANDRRDNHLRTQDFFWTEKYPYITFVSSKVVPGADANHFKVEGDLTIRDVTRPVVLDAEFLGMGPVSIDKHQMGIQAGWLATTTVRRQDFGIVWNKALDQGGMMLGDDVEIVLQVAAYAPDPEAADVAAPTAK